MVGKPFNHLSYVAIWESVDISSYIAYSKITYFMGKLGRGFKFIFSSYKRTAAILFITALTLAIPITITLVREQQDIRQRAAQVCSNVAADIMLVIDKSDSMNNKTSSTDTTPLIDKAKTAAKSFVDIVATDTNNRLGLASFSSSSNSTLDVQLTNNFGSVKTKIDTLTASGATCTECGIKRANNEISARKRAGFKNAVILLTDGRATITQGSSTEDESAAERAALQAVRDGNTANGTVYFTIGLGNKVNATFLQEIATRTGGKYFAAPSADDLQSIYQQISQIVGKGAITAQVFNDLNSNGQLDTGEAGLAEWRVHATLASDTNQLVASGATDASGFYSAAGICDGEYTVIQSPILDGWVATIPSNSRLNTIVTNASSSTVSFGVKQTTTPACNASCTSNTECTGATNGCTACINNTCQVPAPTATPSGTLLNLNLQLTGIGVSSSDSARLGINSDPKRPQRDVQAAITNAQNAQVASFSSTVTFEATSGKYKGTLNLGNNFQTGPYLIKARLNNTLWRTAPGIQNIENGTTNNSTDNLLVSGDVNQDNEINLMDYNLMLTCLHNASCNTAFVPGDASSSATFTMDRMLFDFNDDDKIDEIDLNILYFGFANRFGD